MLELSPVDAHPSAAFSYLASNDPASSSSSALPHVSASSSQLVSAASQQSYPSGYPSYPTNGSGYEPASITTATTTTTASKKRKFRSAVDKEIVSQTSDRVASCLASDHISVLFPDVNTPFADVFDVTRRLLPYHVFQHPASDLKSVTVDPGGKGKAKASGQDLLREEIADTRFALKCFKRRKELGDRFKRAKFKSGERENPDDQAYVLAQAVLESDRADNTSASAQLRAARIELDKVQREKRTAAVSQRPMVYAQTSYPYTPQYRHYTYPYAQYQPGYQQVYSSYPTPTNSQPMTPVTQLQPPNTSITAIQPQQSELVTRPIPVQLPVASLTALHALGIIPVPATSLPPPDQPQPQAILRGTTSNGTMLSLEINLSLLRSTQTSGLALILNSLTTGAASGVTGSTPSI